MRELISWFVLRKSILSLSSRRLLIFFNSSSSGSNKREMWVLKFLQHALDKQTQPQKTPNRRTYLPHAVWDLRRGAPRSIFPRTQRNPRAASPGTCSKPLLGKAAGASEPAGTTSVEISLLWIKLSINVRHIRPANWRRHRARTCRHSNWRIFTVTEEAALQTWGRNPCAKPCVSNQKDVGNCCGSNFSQLEHMSEFCLRSICVLCSKSLSRERILCTLFLSVIH